MVSITDTTLQNKIAKKKLLHLVELKESYARAMSNMAFIGAAVSDGQPHGTDVGDPTQKKAFDLLKIEQDHKWILAIELAEKNLSERQLKFLEFRRDAELQMITGPRPQGRPGWVGYVQSHYAEWYYDKYGKDFVPTERALHDWMDKIVEKTVRIAIYKGCFD